MVNVFCLSAVLALLHQITVITSTDNNFIVVSETKTFSEANSHCVSNYGVNLAKVENENDNTAVESALNSASVTGDVWIGLRTDNGINTWMDGDIQNYDNWLPGEPNSNDEDCAVFFYSGISSTSGWNDFNCDSVKKFVCGPMPVAKISANQKYIAVSLELTFDEADNYCQTHFDSNLATITDGDAQNEAIDAINDLVGVDTGDNVWIGLNDIDNENTFVWKDGSSDTYRNWIDNPVEPNGGTNENCVVMWMSGDSSTDGKWNDISCSSSNTFSFVCGYTTTSLDLVYDIGDYNMGEYDNDIGLVFEEIFHDMIQQHIYHGLNANTQWRGGMIKIPPNHYILKTPVLINKSFLTIQGSNNGWRSGPDYDIGKGELTSGGSRITSSLSNTDDYAFTIYRDFDTFGRISSVQFRNFIIDGRAVDLSNPLNQNAIKIDVDNDAITIENMVIINCNHGLYAKNNDAMLVINNLFAELYKPIYFVSNSKSCLISNNRIGAAGKAGTSLYIENAQDITVTGNNIFPDGTSNIYLANGCQRCLITGNHLTSYCAGAITSTGTVSKTHITGNFIGYTGDSTIVNTCGTNHDDLNFGLVNIGGEKIYISNNFFDCGAIAMPHLVWQSGVTASGDNGNFLPHCE